MDHVEVLIPIIAIGGFFSMVCYIVAAIAGSRNRGRVEQLRSALQMRMIDKFGTAAEFIEFTRSPEGKIFMEGAAVERPIVADRMLNWVRRGIVLTAMGLGFAILTLSGTIERDGGVITLVLLLSSGIGMLVAAMMSRRLGQSWGADDSALTHRAEAM